MTKGVGFRGAWLAGGVLALVLLVGVRGATAGVTYDTEDLGVGGPVQINSVGAVLFTDGEDWIVRAPDGTLHTASLPDTNLLGLSDPLPSASLGVAWGYRAEQLGDGTFLLHPAVWDPLGSTVEPELPAGIDPLTTTEATIDGVAFILGFAADGWMYFNATGAGFAWDPVAGTLLQLPPPNGGDASIVAISPCGKVLAWDQTTGDLFVWDRGTDAAVSLSDSAVVSGVTPAINDAGEVVLGTSFWSATGDRTDLLEVSPLIQDATRLSNSGWVTGLLMSDVGQLFTSSLNSPSVFVWNAHDGRFFDLTDEIVAADGAGGVPATVVEDGTVVGIMSPWWASGNPDYFRPFVWTPDDGFTDLAATLGDGYPDLQGINRLGKVAFGGPGVEVFSWQRTEGLAETVALPDTAASLRYALEEVLWHPARWEPYQRMNDLGQYVGMSTAWRVILVTPRGATPPGEDVQIQPDSDTTITFEGISTPGETTVVAYDVDDPEAPTLPPDFALAGTGALINISTTATFSGSIHLALHYDQGAMEEGGTDEQNVRILHFEDGQWVDVTDDLDMDQNIVYGVTTSLSPFAIVEALDVTPPVIASVADVNAYATSTQGAVVNYTAPTANDDRDGSVSVTCDPASGTLFDVGVTTVTCTAHDARNNTATATFDVIVQIDPHYLKGAVADQLNSLIPTSDKKTVKKLLKAIQDIEDSLAADLWADDFHLTEKGRKVFKEESEAVAQLVAIADPPSAVGQAVLSLVEADRVLAGKAVDEATAANPTSQHLDTANSELGLAADSATAGEYRDAIQHYRKAWKAALKAQGLL